MIRLPRTLFTRTLTIALLATATAAPAVAADSFPSRPLQIVVSAAPGGSPDILARIVAKALSARVGQPVSVDNRPGGAGNIAATHVARSPADGYTLFVATDSISINQTLFRNLPFDARTSFAPVIHAISSPQVFAVHPDVPARSVQEFVRLAKAAPDRYGLASPAIGTTGQLGVLLLQSQAAIQVKPVVYRSAQPALTDVLGKHADGIIVTIAPALPFIKEGKLRALGVSTGTRSAALPDVPTFVEQGLPDFKFDSWQGFVVPGGTPQPVIDRLNTELNAVLTDRDVKTKLLAQAFDTVGGSPADFGKVINDSIASWEKVIRSHDIHID
jgi:tripartite-type tricarboxylate transporter receptor subunit TctC